MSKTSEKNSEKQVTGSLLRQLKGWVTGSYHKLKRDIYLSTRLQIILFHTFSVLVIILVIVQLFDLTQRSLMSAVAESLMTVVETGEVNGDVIAQAAFEVETTKRVVFVIIVGLSAIFGIIATRLALQPVRESLVQQRKFIATIAHELRTPLSILRIENELATGEPENQAMVRETLENNVHEIDRITEILNNLLLFSRVDTLESISFGEVDMNNTLKTVHRRLERLAEKRGVQLRFEGVDVPNIYGNTTALEQVLFNVIKNAIVYTRRGGEVGVTCSSTTDKSVTLTIQDTGRGISKKQLPHIFEPFFRSESTTSADTTGTGLGLAIVFEIMKLHNGKISVESAQGVGTKFHLTFLRDANLTTLSSREQEKLTYDFSLHAEHKL